MKFRIQLLSVYEVFQMSCMVIESINYGDATILLFGCGARIFFQFCFFHHLPMEWAPLVETTITLQPVHVAMNSPPCPHHEGFDEVIPYWCIKNKDRILTPCWLIMRAETDRTRPWQFKGWARQIQNEESYPVIPSQEAGAFLHSTQASTPAAQYPGMMNNPDTSVHPFSLPALLAPPDTIGAPFLYNEAAPGRSGSTFRLATPLIEVNNTSAQASNATPGSWVEECGNEASNQETTKASPPSEAQGLGSCYVRKPKYVGGKVCPSSGKKALMPALAASSVPGQRK